MALRPCLHMYVLIGMFLLPVALSEPLHAQNELTPPTKLETQADVGQFLDTYYMKPRPQWITPAFEIMSKGPLLTNPAARGPLIVFIGTTTAANPQAVAPLVQLASTLTKEQAGVIYAGLWFANTDATRATLRQVSENSRDAEVRNGIDDLMRKQPPDLGNIPIDSPAILDMLWAQYLASGNTQALQRVISTLPWVMEQGKVERYVIGHAARESLIANCKRHPAVLKYCRDTIDGQPPEAQRVLEHVIDIATQGKR